MKSGATLLRTWLNRSGHTQQAFSDKLGIHEAYVSFLVNGKRSPGLHLAVKISRLTGIPVESWMSLRADKAPIHAKRSAAQRPYVSTSQGEVG